MRILPVARFADSIACAQCLSRDPADSIDAHADIRIAESIARGQVIRASSDPT
jgi:hypothetical protein